MTLSVLLATAISLISGHGPASDTISADLMTQVVHHRVETMQRLTTSITVKPLNYPWPKVKRSVFLVQFPDTIRSRNVENALKLFGYRPVRFATLQTIAELYPSLPNDGYVVAAGECFWFDREPFWLVAMPRQSYDHANTTGFNLRFYFFWDPTVWFMVEEIP